MADCCTPSGYDDMFDEKGAGRDLKQYDKKGLDGMAQAMVRYVANHGVEDTTVLEVGGGIGACQVELLKAGASSAVSVDISDGYEEVSRELFEREGLTERVERVVGDFAATPEGFAPADIVVMNRVICCYPDMDRLLRAGLGRSRRFVAASFPRHKWVTKVAIGTGNLYCRCTRSDFRAYLHSPALIIETARFAGFTPVFEEQDFIWKAVVFEKVS